MIIRDPNDGAGMGVNDDGYGKVSAVSHNLQFRANLFMQNSYNAVISVTPTGAGDCFFYLKNDDSSDLIINTIKLYSASSEQVQFKFGDSGTIGGTHAALTPVSKNAGSGKVADVTCESGVDMTGLSGGSIIEHIYTSTTMQRWFWDSTLILPKNRILTLYAVTGAVALQASIGFFFCDLCEGA